MSLIRPICLTLSFLLLVLLACLLPFTWSRPSYITLTPLHASPRDCPIVNTVVGKDAQCSFVLTISHGTVTFSQHHTTLTASFSPTDPVTFQVTRDHPTWFADVDWSHLAVPDIALMGFASRWGFLGGRGTSGGDYLWSYQNFFRVPIYALLILFAILPIRFARTIPAAIRRRRARSAGLCPKCRYDLRPHKPGDHCPECGTKIPIP